ncbi:MFS transporter [Legionella sp. W05-934-2]|uniref:MFS transporter n=1 Tax=Legionella sp. W05-934-2 TaxID=1198649 RepID=UPI003462796D
MPTSEQTTAHQTLPKASLSAWLICLLAALFYAYDFVLRISPSVMIHPLMSWFDVSATQLGLLSAFYYYAYTPLQLPSGVIVDKWPLRWVLSGSAFCCAIGCFIFASTDSLIIAYISRAMMGLGSAFAFVGALKLAALRLPQYHFALFSGIATALGTLGAMATDMFLSRSVEAFGWQNSIYMSGFIGLGIAILLALTIRPTPKSMDSLKANSLSWRVMISRMWALFKQWRFLINGFIGAMLFMPVSVIASLWGVDFLAQRYGITNSMAASMTSVIFLGMAISAPFSGWLSNYLGTRKQLLFCSAVVISLLLIIIIYTPWLNVWFVNIALLLLGMAVGPQVLTFAIAKDMSPKGSTGVATASTNFLITLSAAIFQPLIGYMLELVWGGQKTAMGTPLYYIYEYREAFYILVLLIALSAVLSLLLPEKRSAK